MIHKNPHPEYWIYDLWIQLEVFELVLVVLNEVLTYNYMGMLESALFFTSR